MKRNSQQTMENFFIKTPKTPNENTSENVSSTSIIVESHNTDDTIETTEDEPVSTSNQPKPPIVVYNYKGCKLSVAWLVNNFSDHLKAVKIGKRNGIQCIACHDNITEAKAASRNGTVPIADGVRCDEKKALERIVDHLQGDVHEIAVRAGKAKKLWAEQSDKHPWVKIMKQHDINIVKTLIRLAIDVHNDSTVKTLSAYSWPSRSLSRMHAENQILQYSEHGLDCSFVPYSPPSSSLRYHSPDIYAEMMSVVASLELENLMTKLHDANCFAIQADKSVDKFNINSLFITARYLDKDNSICVAFLGETHSDKHGAEGLAASIFERLNTCGMSDDAISDKLIGLTTDGEAANTGCHTGLWKRMADKLGRGLITIWCIAHRSDLAFEDIESSVSEFRHWKADLKSLATFYRASSYREESLSTKAQELQKKSVKFPKHHEVRFAEHMLKLADAVLTNLPFMREDWKNIMETGNKTEKLQARGFARNWMPDSKNVKLTAVIADVLHCFKSLQKEAQRSLIILPDLVLRKEITVKSLKMMVDQPFPGGREESHVIPDAVTSVESNRRSTGNSFVTTSNRQYSSVRLELIMAAINFLEERLDDEQDVLINSMKGIANAQSAIELIKIARPLVAHLFGEHNVQEFAEDVISFFASSDRMFSNNDSITAKIFEMLKKTVKGSLLNRLIQAFIITSPHSMITERAVKHHTLLKSDIRSSLSRSAINDRLTIALNSSGKTL